MMTRQARRAPKLYSLQLSGPTVRGRPRLEKYSTLLARATRRPPIIALPGPHPPPPIVLLPPLALPCSRFRARGVHRRAPTCFLASPFACVRRPIVVVHARPHVYYQNSLFASRHMYPYFTVSPASRLAHRLVCSRLPSPLPLASPPTLLLDPPSRSPAPAPQCVVGLEARMHTTYVFIAYLVVLLLHRRCAVFTPYLSLTLSLSLAPILALRISPRPA